MKTAKILSFALASTTLFISCKKEVNPSKEIKKTFYFTRRNWRWVKKGKAIVSICSRLWFRVRHFHLGALLDVLE